VPRLSDADPVHQILLIFRNWVLFCASVSFPFPLCSNIINYKITVKFRLHLKRRNTASVAVLWWLCQPGWMPKTGWLLVLLLYLKKEIVCFWDGVKCEMGKDNSIYAIYDTTIPYRHLPDNYKYQKKAWGKRKGWHWWWSSPFLTFGINYATSLPKEIIFIV
jgi:hypothetical protein